MVPKAVTPAASDGTSRSRAYGRIAYVAIPKTDVAAVSYKGAVDRKPSYTSVAPRINGRSFEKTGGIQGMALNAVCLLLSGMDSLRREPKDSPPKTSPFRLTIGDRRAAKSR